MKVPNSNKHTRLQHYTIIYSQKGFIVHSPGSLRPAKEMINIFPKLVFYVQNKVSYLLNLLAIMNTSWGVQTWQTR